MLTAYVAVFIGSFDFVSHMNLVLVYIFAILFFATRMGLAVKTQNMVSFKRNAIAVEVYIFLMCINRFSDLLMSGVGFIVGGVAVFGLIYLLRKTSKYIKTMAVFHE